MGFIAMKIGKPVKWVESRRENFSCTIHGRGHVDYFELAAKRDGTMLGLRLKLIQDLGAYLQLLTPAMPTLSVLMMPGLYRFKNISADIVGVFTNCVPTDAYRGAGRPEATHGIERMVDMLAAELKMDPVEIRLKNFVGNDEFPYPTATGLFYDSGDYAKPLRQALAVVDYTQLRAQQARERAAGKLMGIGISTYGEICAMGPSPALPAGGWESATVKIEPTGKVTVMTGASPHGQGEETTFAQIAADELGVDMDDVLVVHGDTAVVQYGIGTFGSRGTAVGGAALFYALQDLKAKMKKFGAMLLKSDNVTLSGGVCTEQGTGKSVSFAEMAVAAYHAKKLPPNTEPGLVATHFWEPPNFTFPFGAHIVADRKWIATPGDPDPPLRLRGRLRQHHQPADRRRAGARRRGARAGAGAVGAGGLRRQRPTGHRRAHRLCPAQGEFHAVDREQPHRNALARESAGREGRGRGRHHRLLARGGELRGGRAVALGRAAHRYAAHAGENLETDSRRRPRMIPNSFDYAAPATLEEALQLIADGSGKILAGGMSLIPLMKLRLASPENLVDLGRVPGLNQIAESGGVVRIGAMATHHEIENSPVVRGKCPLLAETAATSATSRCATWAPLAAASRMPTRRPIIRPRWWRWRPRCAWSAPRGSVR